MLVTLEQLIDCTGAKRSNAEKAYQGINDAMETYSINTLPRIGMFLANVGHECGGFRWPEEIWGPTPAQMRYEPPGKKAFELGNSVPGDGKRFRGRGWLQTTGKNNYRRLTARLRARGIRCPDFEFEPEKLALPEWAAISAADYVDMRDLNKLADAGEFDHYCDKINLGRETDEEGDSNGYAARLALWIVAQKVLA